jgi:hypothetical protein
MDGEFNTPHRLPPDGDTVAVRAEQRSGIAVQKVPPRALSLLDRAAAFSLRVKGAVVIGGRETLALGERTSSDAEARRRCLVQLKQG